MIIKFFKFKQLLHLLSYLIKIWLALGLHRDISFCISLGVGHHHHVPFAFAFVVVTAKGMLMNIASSLVQEYDMSFMKLIVKVFLNVIHCSEVCPFLR